MLEVVFIIDATYYCYRLNAGAERPICPLFRQRPRMPRLCVRRRLSRMAGRASTGANEMLARSYPGQREEDENVTAGYQTNRPLNWICRPNTPARWATTLPKVAEVGVWSGSAAGKRFVKL